MNQLQLFQDSKVEITPELHTLAKSDPDQAYTKLRAQGLPIGQSLYFILDKNMETDFVKLWDFFESKGYFLYFKITFFGKVYTLKDVDSDFYLNDHYIFSWSETDIFDSAMTAKIKKKLKQFVLDNQYQFGLD